MSRKIGTGLVASTLLLLGACAQTDSQPDSDSLNTSSRHIETDGRYIVTYKTPAGRAAAARARGGVALELPSRSAVAVRLTGAEASALRGRADIADVEEDVRRYPMAEVVPYGVTMVGADEVPAAPPSGAPRVTVCIIDSGLRAGHEDFAGLPVGGSNNPGTGNWNEDTCGHGTHVAGTIAAVAGNDVGVVGVAPDAVKLHIVKVFSGLDCAWTYSSTLVAALDQCRAAGAKVVSMSLGGSARSRLEERAFDAASAAGVLSIAAAGNDGNKRMSFPASYPSVMSVAAIDQNKLIADFSQQNKEVDIAAPGVGVRSTYVFRSALTVGGTSYDASHIENAPFGSASGTLVDGGLCDSVGGWAGQVVLCQRGTISFFEKVANAEAGGAAGVVLYNNVPGGFSGTLGDGNTSAIPAISISQEAGQALVASSLGQTATVVSDYGDGYAELDGTSMATPHVSAVAALVWAQFPSATAAQIRAALTSTAEDLGAAGRDNAYGAGLVRAGAAYQRLLQQGL